MLSPIRAALCCAASIALFLTSSLALDDPPPVPGEVHGTGHHFEIVDSDYLDVTLESTEEVDVLMHSMGETILISVAAASGATSTQLTLSGLAPSATYYLRSGGRAEDSITTGADGKYVFTQKLAEPELVSIRETSGTYYIAPRYNDCRLIGVWDGTTKTCTLTRDVSDWIYLYNVPGTTLDGNGYRLTYPYDFAIQLSYCNDCTVRNLDLDGSHGVLISASQRVTVADNTIRSSYYAVYVYRSTDTTIAGNTVAARNPSSRPFGFPYTHRTDVTRNSVTGHRYGPLFYHSSDNQIYNNNFSAEMLYPVLGSDPSSYDNVFYKPFPDGGNWWERYDDPAEGCHDTDADLCCDAHYYLGSGSYDDFPWTERDAWLARPLVANAGPDRTLEATCSNDDRTSTVTLDGSGSRGPEDESLTYSWEGPTCPTATGATPDVDLGLGAHRITLTVVDGSGRTDSDEVTITMLDKAAPALTCPAPLQVTCTQVSAAGRGQCPSSDPGVAGWVALATAIDACDPVPAITDDCPPMLEVNRTAVTFAGIDASGNLASDDSSIQVLYGWGGFNGIRGGQAGMTIPVRFSLDCGGEPVSAAVASIAVYNVLGGPEMVGGSDNAVRYDPVERRYAFDLSTTGYDAPATYRIYVMLDDGTIKTIEFSLRKLTPGARPQPTRGPPGRRWRVDRFSLRK